MKFLEHIIITDEIQMNLVEIKAILEWSMSKSIKKMQSFIELINYYRKFIKNYSTNIAVLTNITKKKLRFHWNNETQKTFEQVKKKFAKKSILTNHNSELKKIVKIDASNRRIKEIFNQKNSQSKLRAVTFYSKKLLSVEMNYEIHDKELLIIVKCFKNIKNIFKKN